MDYTNIIKALEVNNYEVKKFDNKELATDYLIENIKNNTVGFGDSDTIGSMDLYNKLAKENTIYDPNQSSTNDDFLKIAKDTFFTDIFITSVNAITKDGIMVNLDGTGNRVASSLFGHKKVYFLVGKNKIMENTDDAIWRVRNIVAPMNTKRLGLRTPCVKTGKCFDCKSPDRICNGLMVYYKKMDDIEMEVILIDEELGY